MSFGYAKIQETVFGPIVVISVILLTIYISQQAKKGKVPYVRRIPALDGIDHAIDVAAKAGKPIYYEVAGAPRGETSQMVTASLSILPHLARRCASKGCRLIIGYIAPDISPIIKNSLETASKLEGKAGFFKPEDIRYLSSDGFAAAGAAMGIIENDDCRAAIAMGGVATQALAEAEANKSHGCIAIQGTATMSQISCVGLVTDYNLIGEELYAAGAMFSNDVDTMSTLRCQDILKLGVVVFIPAAVIAIYLGFKF